MVKDATRNIGSVAPLVLFIRGLVTVVDLTETIHRRGINLLNIKIEYKSFRFFCYIYPFIHLLNWILILFSSCYFVPSLMQPLCLFVLDFWPCYIVVTSLLSMATALDHISNEIIPHITENGLKKGTIWWFLKSTAFLS